MRYEEENNVAGKKFEENYQQSHKFIEAGLKMMLELCLMKANIIHQHKESRLNQ